MRTPPRPALIAIEVYNGRRGEKESKDSIEIGDNNGQNAAGHSVPAPKIVIAMEKKIPVTQPRRKQGREREACEEKSHG